MTDEKIQVITPEDEAKMTRMKEILTQKFENDKLFEIFKKRNRLDEIFTVPILLMDENELYSTNEVAQILEVPTHHVLNKRKELVDYIKPEISNTVWRYTYESVFKLKMIICLTGHRKDYTLVQLRNIIESNDDVGESSPIETQIHPQKIYELQQLIDDLKAYLEYFNNEFEQDVKDQIAKEIERRMEQFSLPAPDTSNIVDDVMKRVTASVSGQIQTILQEDNEIKNVTVSLYENLKTEISLEKKKEIAKKLSEYERQHPDQAYFINMYKVKADEHIASIEQGKREEEIQKMKDRIEELYLLLTTSELNPELQKKYVNELSELKEIKELPVELRLLITRLLNDTEKSKVQKKTGFLSRIFGQK